MCSSGGYGHDQLYEQHGHHVRADSIAASTAIAGGYNVRNVVLVVAATAWMMAFVLPTGSSAAIMGFGMGNHNPMKTMKFTLPLIVILVVSLIISANIFYPIM